MVNKFGLKILAVFAALVLIVSSVAMYSAIDEDKGIDEGGGKGAISLEAPAFIMVAGAAEVAGDGGGAFPENKAGISAYINTNQTIDIEKIKTIFPEVVEVGDNYIIGITPIPDYGGNIGVHVYADTDGWVVAYIGNDEPASMIMQWGTADVNNPIITTITTTILEDALHKAGDAAGVGIVSSKIKYYDFEYPNANSMMIFIKTCAANGVNTHQVEIPADYMLFEASYYHYIYYYGYYRTSGNYYYWDSILKVDGTPISDADTYESPSGYRWWRSFTSYGGKITPGTLHTIEISYWPIHVYSLEDYGSAGVATVLIYRDA